MITFDLRDKIVFFRWTLCLMDKNGILCPSKNVTLASEHVSYLENGLVLMAQFFTIFSFCKYVQFRYHYGFQHSGQRKMCFPYTTTVLVPSIMRYAISALSRHILQWTWFIAMIQWAKSCSCPWCGEHLHLINVNISSNHRHHGKYRKYKASSEPSTHEYL